MKYTESVRLNSHISLVPGNAWSCTFITAYFSFMCCLVYNKDKICHFFLLTFLACISNEHKTAVSRINVRHSTEDS